MTHRIYALVILNAVAIGSIIAVVAFAMQNVGTEPSGYVNMPLTGLHEPTDIQASHH